VAIGPLRWIKRGLANATQVMDRLHSEPPICAADGSWMIDAGFRRSGHSERQPAPSSQERAASQSDQSLYQATDHSGAAATSSYPLVPYLAQIT
jgi:hypothetical protein